MQTCAHKCALKPAISVMLAVVEYDCFCAAPVQRLMWEMVERNRRSSGGAVGRWSDDKCVATASSAYRSCAPGDSETFAGKGTGVEDLTRAGSAPQRLGGSGCECERHRGRHDQI